MLKLNEGQGWCVALLKVPSQLETLFMKKLKCFNGQLGQFKTFCFS